MPTMPMRLKKRVVIQIFNNCTGDIHSSSFMSNAHDTVIFGDETVDRIEE